MKRAEIAAAANSEQQSQGESQSGGGSEGRFTSPQGMGGIQSRAPASMGVAGESVYYTNTIYVGDLRDHTGQQDLASCFSRFGEISENTGDSQQKFCIHYIYLSGKRRAGY